MKKRNLTHLDRDMSVEEFFANFLKKDFQERLYRDFEDALWPITDTPEHLERLKDDDESYERNRYTDILTCKIISKQTD